MKNYIALMRPKQWIKNVFVLASLLFSKNFLIGHKIWTIVLLTGYFIIISSIIYVFNDMVDVDKDRYHPKKKYRPLACGALTKKQAIIFLVVLGIIAMMVSLFFEPLVNGIILIYMINNIGYSLIFKHYVIIDAIIIAMGFLLRVVVGALAIHEHVSSWILICTFFMAMLMALGKRRSEIICLEEKANAHRKNLQLYSIQVLDYMLLICVACTIMTYSLYSILEQQSQLFLITILFVFYGVIRYIFLLFNSDGSKMPEELIIEDQPLVMAIACYGLVTIGILAFIP
ncbi:UbiA prenyltransferase family protein [Vallitalea pronyensis]|uniref:UbiA prenyltransferase family protein n=1 Tax=Vallitalea pronyensis TaxID=1348613 RepID=A0A8J8MHK3_9FIRM|nr:UbiA prenyltransferase family protein [Vallitalea pronyensis]QUI21571.1 UbiA prenyltransferase family protein [Vallitalea pronyensis]